MKMLAALVVSGMFCGCTVFGISLTPPVQKITGRIVDDETGRPIPNAEIMIYDHSWPSWRETDDLTRADKDGKVVIMRQACSGACFVAYKDGYYPNGNDNQIAYEDDNPELHKGKIVFYRDKILNIWKPWNPEITVRMRRIKNPMPMFQFCSDDSEFSLPLETKQIEYDFLMQQPLPPLGKGKFADMVFSVDKDIIGESAQRQEFHWSVKFLHPEDGFAFRTTELMPLEAPEKGYQSRISFEIKTNLKNLNEESNMPATVGMHWVTCFFRITRPFLKGNIVYYGLCDIPKLLRIWRKSQNANHLYLKTTRYQANAQNRSLEYNGCNLFKEKGILDAVMEDKAKQDDKFREVVKACHAYEESDKSRSPAGYRYNALSEKDRLEYNERYLKAMADYRALRATLCLENMSPYYRELYWAIQQEKKRKAEAESLRIVRQRMAEREAREKERLRLERLKQEKSAPASPGKK